ncbi:MAG: O-antigen ligase family protein [Bacilli bacterium]|nr:O-antigen ligase family protein [Bacilli bacterium]
MKKSIIYYLFLLLPFIDVITSLLTKNTSISITPGIIVKVLLIIYFIIYCINTKSKYKKISMFLIISSLLYLVLYFIFKIELLSKLFIFNELQFLFKLIFYPVIFGGMLCYFDEHSLDSEYVKKVFVYTLICYAFLIFIPILFGISNTTYPSLDAKGYIGFFYSGNEVANILIILLPSSLYFIDKNKYSFLILFPIFYLCFLIGTKVAAWGAIIVSVISLLYYLLNKKYKNSIICLLLGVLSVFMTANGYVSHNIKILNSKEYTSTMEEIVIDEQNIEEVTKINEKVNKFYDLNAITKKLKPLLNGRDLLFANTLSIYNNSDKNIFFGIGYSNTDKVKNSNIERLIEIDFLDIYFHNGILGLVIVLLPLLVSIYLFFKSRLLNSKIFYLLLMLFLVIGISSFSGHVFLCPAVTIYLIMLLCLFINELGFFKKKDKDDKKISILALHLNYGGVEKAIIDQANMLSSNYDVSIISLYKMNNKIPYHINDNVKVVYLSNLKPNREEFKDAINSKNIIKIFKEGFRALCILYKKKYLMINYIYKCNSKIIISSRYDFTKLLSLYGDSNTIKIAEEHSYHNNRKAYIFKLGYYLQNIDYIIPSSKYITDDYKEFYKRLKVNILYLPLAIDYIPKSLNKLDNYNIISVGRISPEKGFFDLVDVYKLVKEKNKKIKLNIVGDGVQFKELKKYVKDNKLDITLSGYKNSDELKEEYSNASLYVMTSFEESFGLVLLEAMSYGIPCIAFDSAKGACEIINAKNGYLINDRNKEDMAKKILDYFDIKEHGKMSMEARNTAVKYSYENVSGMWNDFIKNLLDGDKK